MLVFAEIGGVKGYYIVDTGSPEIIMFESVHDLPEIKSNYDSYWIMGQTFSGKRYKSNQITIDGEIFNGGFTMTEAPEIFRLSFSPEIKGLFNPLAVNASAIEISFSRHKIILHETLPEGYTKSLPYVTTEWESFAYIDVNNASYPFRIDTGNTDNVHFPEELLKSIEQKNIMQTDIRPAAGTNRFFFKNNDFVLFNHKYTDIIGVTGTLLDKKTTGGIGIEMLQKYDLVFDRVNKELYYKPLWPDMLYDVLFRHEIISHGILDILYLGDDFLVVNEILVDSPAWKSGIRPGDKITRINSYTGGTIPKRYVEQIMYSTGKIQVEYISSQTNQKKTVNITAKTLLK